MPVKPTSRVHTLIRHALEENASRGQQGDLPEGKVTVRLQAVDYFRLAQLASLMDASRTRAAAQLLSAALRDAVHTAGLPTEGDEFKAQLKAFLDAEFPQEAPSVTDH